MNRVLVPLQLDGAAPSLGARTRCIGGETMGTTWQVRWAASEAPCEEVLRAAVQAELNLVVAQMSTWLPGSDLDRFNRAPAGSRHTLPEAFGDVLDAALRMAHISGGAFNPAAGALVNVWGFGPSPKYTDPGFLVPGGPEVLAALARTDWCGLRWDAGLRQVHQPGDVWLDLSAIAKGHAVDRVVHRLEALGVHSALVEVGGELRGQGFGPGGQPWWVDLESPPMPHGAPEVPTTRVALHGVSVATSGDYRRAFEHQGAHWPHTIDPRDGRPVSHGLASVSVLHGSCMWADAWSTALMVLGRNAGLALAVEHGIAALFVQRERSGCLTESLTPALEALAE
jgi:thiamine biosynthesis lipoprotein